MVTFPPLAPSATWFCNFFMALQRGDEESQAFLYANSRLHSTRDFARFCIKSPLDEEMILSPAIEGGGRQLRTMCKIEGLNLSEHGDWRNRHLKALDACLGRKPFFPYLASPLRQVYENTELKTLQDFNLAIFRTLMTFLMGNLTYSQLEAFIPEEKILERGKEIWATMNPEISIFQSLASYGRETLTAILTSASEVVA